MHDFVFITFGLFLWILGANWLLKGAVSLSVKFNIPKMVVGMIVVSLATSVPELLLGLKSVTDDMPNMALGSTIGANIANLGLVLAIATILSGIVVNKRLYVAHWSVMMLASALFFGFIYFDGEIQRFEGFFMLMALLLLMVYLIWSQRNSELDVLSRDDKPLSLYGMVLFLGLGGLAIWGGSEILLKSVLKYAAPDGTDGRIFAITILSWVASIPEFILAIIAIIRKQKTIIFGNILGAGMFNVLGVLGIFAMKGPIKVMDSGLLFNDILWMMGVSLLILPLMFLSRGSRLDWRGGTVLLGIYLAFLYFALIC